MKVGKRQTSVIVSPLIPPPQTAPQHSEVGCLISVNTEGSVPHSITGVPSQRNMAQMKEQIKTPEKVLSDEEIVNLFDAEFKTLVNRMLTKMIEYRHKIGEVKVMQSDIQKIIQGTNSEGKEMDLNKQSGTKGRNKHSTRTQ